LLDIAKDLLSKGAPVHGTGFDSLVVVGGVLTTLSQSMKQFTELFGWRWLSPSWTLGFG
jgi:hypothetical protein